MEPANVVLHMRQNGDYRHGFELFDKTTKERADWAGYTARMQVRSALGILIADLTTENGGIVLGAAPGTIDLFIQKEVLAVVEPQAANYDFILLAPNGDDIPLFYGKAIIAKGETRD